MKKIVVFTVLLVWVGMAKGQESGERLPVNISYFGKDGTHAGFKIGTETTIWELYREKEKRSGKIKTKERELFLTANLGFYHHRRNHSGLFTNTEIGFRRITNKRRMRGILFGVGYMRTFLAGTTYEADGNGGFAEKRLAGNGYFMPSAAFFFGGDLEERTGLPMKWHFKPTMFLQLPYNHAFNINGALELGITYQFKNFGIRKK